MPTLKPHQFESHSEAVAREEATRAHPYSGRGVTAVLGPTNTGKTHLAIERMVAHPSGLIGLPLRLLAREVYTRLVERVGPGAVALVTGEEKIYPPNARYSVCTVEALPRTTRASFVAIDEVQLAGDLGRGHVFTDRILNLRGLNETLLLGSETMRPILTKLLPGLNILTRPRMSVLHYAGSKKITRLPRKSAIVAFSADEVYAIAELIRRQRGGAAVVLGALSPRTRNAQVELFQSGDVEFLVATDAIGMGLNLDLDHVAFAQDHKFDGFQTRPLDPAEMAQIAGRAGRHIKDGTFGVTGHVMPLPDETVQRIESHDFAPIKRLQWRSPEFDYSSLEALKRSIESPPNAEGLTRALPAHDARALDILSRDEGLMTLANTPLRVKLLWEACTLPDYRRIAPAQHAELVASIFKDLATRGHVDEEFMASQVERADRTDGEIDTLSARVAQIRTWTFVSHRPNWLRDPTHWQGRTREIEDRLSDALHERLTKRFVDRRTSVLMRRLRENAVMEAEIGPDGDVSVEGHAIGHLEGFRFRPDRAAEGQDAKAVAAASQKALALEFEARAARLGASPNSDFALGTDGKLRWQGQIVGQLASTNDPLRPRVVLLADDALSGPSREKVANRLERHVKHQIETQLKPLLDLRDAPTPRAVEEATADPAAANAANGATNASATPAHGPDAEKPSANGHKITSNAEGNETPVHDHSGGSAPTEPAEPEGTSLPATTSAGTDGGAEGEPIATDAPAGEGEGPQQSAGSMAMMVDVDEVSEPAPDSAASEEQSSRASDTPTAEPIPDRAANEGDAGGGEANASGIAANGGAEGPAEGRKRNRNRNRKRPGKKDAPGVTAEAIAASQAARIPDVPSPNRGHGKKAGKSRNRPDRREMPQGDGSIGGTARGIAFRLVEEFGVIPRRDIANELQSLDQSARASLRRYGVRFGFYHVFIPALLKPGPAELATLLWALQNDALDRPGYGEVVPLLASGRTSVEVNKEFDPNFYRLAGFRVMGGRAVRIDILERLADIIRPAVQWDGKGKRPEAGYDGKRFIVTPGMMSILGAKEDELADVLRALGYKSESVKAAEVATKLEEMDQGHPPQTEATESGVKVERKRAKKRDGAEKPGEPPHATTTGDAEQTANSASGMDSATASQSGDQVTDSEPGSGSDSIADIIGDAAETVAGGAIDLAKAAIDAVVPDMQQAEDGVASSEQPASGNEGETTSTPEPEASSNEQASTIDSAAKQSEPAEEPTVLLWRQGPPPGSRPRQRDRGRPEGRGRRDERRDGQQTRGKGPRRDDRQGERRDDRSGKGGKGGRGPKREREDWRANAGGGGGPDRPRDRKPDPDSPFAALAALKGQLDDGGQGGKKRGRR